MSSPCVNRSANVFRLLNKKHNSSAVNVEGRMCRYSHKGEYSKSNALFFVIDFSFITCVLSFRKYLPKFYDRQSKKLNATLCDSSFILPTSYCWRLSTCFYMFGNMSLYLYTIGSVHTKSKCGSCVDKDSYFQTYKNKLKAFSRQQQEVGKINEESQSIIFNFLDYRS